MISSDRAQLAAQVARPRNRMMALMLSPIRSKNVTMTMAEGRFISYVGQREARGLTPLEARC